MLKNLQGSFSGKGPAYLSGTRLVVLLATCFFLFLVFRYLGGLGGNVTALICIGDPFLPEHWLPPDAVIFEGTVGYDGQFFYVMAHDPLLRTDLYLMLDTAAYRYQRMLYPLLVAILSMGIRDFIPFMMLLVNVAGVAMGTFFVARMLKDHGLSPWFAFSYTFLSGLFLATVRDLSGPLATGFMVGSFFFYERRRYVWSALFVCCAVLTREVMLVLAPLLACHSLFFRREWKGAPWFVLSLLPFALWEYYLFHQLQILPWTAGKRAFGMPFVALAGHVKDTLLVPRPWTPESVYLVFFLAATLLTLLIAIREVLRSPDEVSGALLFYSMMPFVMSDIIWVDPWAYSRIFLPSASLLILSFVRTRGRRLHALPMVLHALLFVVVLKWLGVIL